MNITEVRVKIADGADESGGRLLGFASIQVDGAFVVRDVKIIEGREGRFVAMPGRKLADRCPGCGTKNHLRARFCNQCGGRLDERRALYGAEGRVKLHADVAHPISSECREAIHEAVMAAYAQELEASRLPGYACRYDGPYPGAERWPSPAAAPAPTLADRVRIRGRAS